MGYLKNAIELKKLIFKLSFQLKKLDTSSLLLVKKEINKIIQKRKERGLY